MSQTWKAISCWVKNWLGWDGGMGGGGGKSNVIHHIQNHTSRGLNIHFLALIYDH